MSRFVCISDLHNHPWSAFSTGDGLRNSRLRLTLNIFEASLVRAEEEGIPWVFGGDLVHTAGYALNSVLAGITDIFACHPDVDKIVVWGNHDARGVGGRLALDQTVFAALARTIRMTVLDPSVTPEVELGGIHFAGAGYQPKIDLLDKVPNTEVGIYHQTVAGSRAANDFFFPEGLDPEMLHARHRLSIVGHIHHPQSIEAPDGQGILIPGSPEHHNFGDHGDHGWWIITLPNTSGEHSDDCALGIGGGCDCPAKELDPELEFISGGSPKFLTVDTPADVQRGEHFYRIRNVKAGEVIPEGVAVVAPTPTTIKHRDTLRGVAEVEQILQVWLKEQPPEDGVVEDYLSVGRTLLASAEPTNLLDAKLTQLHLHNFCCFEDQIIWIEEGVWLLTGIGKDYPSNGAGKSTLVGEALYWLLFGKTTKGLGAEEVIRWGQKECWVQGQFHDEEMDNNVTVTRQRGPDGHTLTIEDQAGLKWSAPSVNEMTAKLGKYLGITPDIFQNLAYFSQEKLLLFSSATDGERKNVLADLIGLNAYQSASSAASAFVAEQEKEQVRLTTRLELLAEQLGITIGEAGEAKEQSVEWRRAHTKRLQTLEQELAEYIGNKLTVLEQDAKELKRMVTEAADIVLQRQESLDTERPEMTRRIQETFEHQHKDKILVLRKDLHLTLTVLETQGYASISEAEKASSTSPQQQQILAGWEDKSAKLSHIRLNLQSEKVLAEGKREQLQRALEEVRAQLRHTQDSLAAGLCPTCQQKITEAHRHLCLLPLQKQEEALADTYLISQEVATTQAEQYQVIEAQCEEAHQRIQHLRVLLAKLSKTSEVLRNVAETEQHIRTLQETAVPAQLVEDKIEAEMALSLSNCKRTQEQRITEARRAAKERADGFARAVEKVEAAIEQGQQEPNPHDTELHRTQSQITTLHGDLDTTRKDEKTLRQVIAMYDYWRHGFSKQGLQSLLVEEVAVRFNANRADIFPLLTQGVYDVQFSTLSHTRSGELREKTEFLVYEHGALIPYGALSGGQRRRIDIGIMLVLTQAVAEWMGTSGILGLLILDEVFGFLDASGAEGLLAALNQVTTRVPTIYVITHDTHLQSMVPNMIQVVQDATGISKVV